MQVDLSELNRVLRPDAKVIISLKYATLVGLQGKPVGGDMTVYQHCVHSGALGVELSKFEDDEASPKKKEDKNEDSDDDAIPLQANLIAWEE